MFHQNIESLERGKKKQPAKVSKRSEFDLQIKGKNTV